MPKRKPKNTHFRQTVKSFKAARQTQVYAKMKRNIPQSMIRFSKHIFNRNMLLNRNAPGKNESDSTKTNWTDKLKKK